MTNTLCGTRDWETRDEARSHCEDWGLNVWGWRKLEVR